MPPRRDRPRDWSPHEMGVILALICAGQHAASVSPLGFADALNKALGRDREPGDLGFGAGRGARDKIDVDDVEELLERLDVERTAAMAFIERQPARRVTRAQARVFQRCIPYTGTLEEWHAGRGPDPRIAQLEAEEAELRRLHAEAYDELTGAPRSAAAVLAFQTSGLLSL